MVQRSLQASPIGIEQAKSAFADKGWTQESLAGEVGLKTRQSIWRFFKGQPIERQVFVAICQNLDLDWRKVAASLPSEFARTIELNQTQDLEQLVQQVRSQRQRKVEAQCSQLHLLDIACPVHISDLYTEINVLQRTFSRTWLEVDDLGQLTAQEFERQEAVHISGTEFVKNYLKVQVLGQVGSGKTTFLQHLATLCNQGTFAASQVPIFVNLKDFAREQESNLSLLNYIESEFLTSGISEGTVIETLLREGRLLLLLDGLDEVLYKTRRIIAQEIRRFSEKYEQNQFIVACRTAARTLELTQFTDVEMAPLNSSQVQDFVQKWIIALTPLPHQEAQSQALQLIELLNSSEHLSFSKLTITPLFLHLICCFFHHQGQIPIRRSEFYRHCLDLLLHRWDQMRGVERDELYANLLPSHRLKLMGQIALFTFEQGKPFFEQKTVEQQISNYLLALPQIAIEPEELSLESANILKAIELQHGFIKERAYGVFCFSEPVFQEYLTAWEIAKRHELQPSHLALDRLAVRLSEPRWREIFLLTVILMRNADDLVRMMKERMDAIAEQDIVVQRFVETLRDSAWDAATTRNLRTRQRRNFTLEQQEMVLKYYDANQLLGDCLRSNCTLTDATRQDIESFLLEK
jgi:predicted NACHT family NTPase